MRLWLALLLMLFTSPAVAEVGAPALSPTLGAQIDLATPLTDEADKAANLGTWLGSRPALVIFGYHDCPNLCGVVQQTVANALAATGLDPTRYTPLFITLAAEEGPADAAGAKSRLATATSAAAAAPWHFLSGSGVQALAEQFGIGAVERARIRQYVHPVAVYMLTPDGRISHVLEGLGITPDDLRSALVDASNGTLGNFIDRVMLFCAGYDPTVGQYTPLVIGWLRIVAVATLLIGGAGLAWLELRKRRWTA